MNVKLLTFSLFSMGAMLASTSHALEVNGGTVNFKGEFVNAACAVSTESDNQIVTLGQHRTASMTSVGHTTTAVPFNIKLVDCSPTVGQETASITFNGVTDFDDPTLIAVNSGTNEPAATGVGIEILDSASNTLELNNNKYSPSIDLIEGTNQLNFFARYKSTADVVTPGRADGMATFKINYQ